MKFTKTAGLMSLLAFAVSGAASAQSVDSGWYVGANAGLSHARLDNKRIAGGLLAGGFTTTAISDDNRHFGYKVFGGYEFNKYFSLEGGYFDLGEFGFLASTMPAGTLSGATTLKGLNLDAVGSLPLTDNLSAFVRIGADYVQARDSFAGTGFVVVTNRTPSERAANYKFGAGLQYDFTRAFGMRLEAERYRINDAVGNKGDIDLFSLGVLYRFGRRAETPVAAIPPPPPAAVAPPPAPPAAVAPAPPPVPPAPRPPKRLALSADALFAFGKATIKPAGKKSLEKLANELKGTHFETLTVLGYSDRLGNPAYNQKLSTRRAEAVRDYLVETLGIPVSKTQAKGMDGSDPVTTPSECPGDRRSPKLIACLQPDRRVEVEVNATR